MVANKGMREQPRIVEGLTAFYVNSPSPPALPAFSEIPGILKFRFYTYPYIVRPTA